MEAPATRHEIDSPKRRAILEAAGTLFRNHGYGAVSMDAVAKAAGVSKATLYAYFTSKDQLFATIISEACQQKMAHGEMRPDADADLTAALTALGDRILRFLLQEEALAIHRVVTAESARFPELGRGFYENGPQAFCRSFGEWLRAQSEAGHLSVADPELAAGQFIGLLRANLYLRATLGIGPPPTEAEIHATVAAAVRTFLRGYAPDGN